MARSVGRKSRRDIGNRLLGVGLAAAVGAILCGCGSLPTISNDRDWLRDAQRFPVQIEFQLPDEADRLAVRVGAQASVITYSGEHWLFNTIGKINIRITSILTYAF